MLIIEASVFSVPMFSSSLECLLDTIYKLNERHILLVFITCIYVFGSHHDNSTCKKKIKGKKNLWEETSTSVSIVILFNVHHTIKIRRHEKKENVTINQEKKQMVEAETKVSQLLKVIDKNFKITMVII